jgi:hypothetical protein
MTAMWSVLGVQDGNDHRAVFVDCCVLLKFYLALIFVMLMICVTGTPVMAHDLCDWDAHDSFHDCTV